MCCILHCTELSALKKDISDLKPVIEQLRTGYESVQHEVSSLREEMKELRTLLKGALGEQQVEETVSLEQLDQQQVS